MSLKTQSVDRESVSTARIGVLASITGLIIIVLVALDTSHMQMPGLGDLLLWGGIILVINQVQRFQKHPLICGMVMIPVLVLPPGVAVLMVAALSFSPQAGQAHMNRRVEMLYHLVVGTAAGLAALAYVLVRGSLELTNTAPMADILIATLAILAFFASMALLLKVFPQAKVLPYSTPSVQAVVLGIQALLLGMLTTFIQHLYVDPLIGSWGGWSVLFVMSPWLYAYHQVSTQATQVASIHSRLQATRSALESLMANLPVGVFRVGLRGQFMSGNAALVNMLGLTSLDELLQCNLSEFVVIEEWPEQTMRQWLAAMREQKVLTREGPLRTRQGEIVWVRSTVRLTLDAEGQVESVDGTVEDITERHTALAELQRTNDLIRQAKQDWEATIDSVPQLVCLLDAQQNVLRANRTLETWGLGMVDAANGLGFNQIMEPLWEGAPKFREQFATAWADLSRNVPSAFEAHAPATDQHFMVHVRPLMINAYRHDDPRNSHAVVTMSDITMRKQLEAALRQLTEELENRVAERTQQLASSNRRLHQEIAEREQLALELAEALQKEKELSDFKTQFSSMISHEFRTPMAIILTAVDMLERYHDRLSETQRREIPDRIRKQVKHLNKLLDDIMTVSRAQTIGVDMALEAVDLIALCDAVCNEARLIDQHRHELVFEAPPDMCPQITVDERLFRQMLENLISNAFKYSPPGSTVRIALDCDHENMWLAVHDEGVGVPPEAQNHLFDAFFRAGNVGAVSGTGLGLALVKLVVDLHNGKIEVQSREGRGSTFIITLPVAPPESEKTPE